MFNTCTILKSIGFEDCHIIIILVYGKSCTCPTLVIYSIFIVNCNSIFPKFEVFKFLILHILNYFSSIYMHGTSICVVQIQV
jgi:hypothetical protein